MKSVLVYTIHKAGSTFLNLLLRQISRRYGIEHLSENDDRYFETIANQSWQSFIQQHQSPKCFGPIRGSTKLAIFPEDLQNYSIVLHLRDPRDVLTSMFYSHAYSHKVREGRFEATLEQREQWKQDGIDDFVLRAAKPLRAACDKLCSNLLGHPNVTVVHYEDMVLNYPIWLANFLSAFDELKIPARKKRHYFLTQSSRRKKIWYQLYDRHKDSFSIETEDVYSHKRKVTPGDHKEKLAAGTVNQLDEIFEDYFTGVSRAALKKLAG